MEKYDCLRLENQLCFPLSAEDAGELYRILHTIMKEWK